MDQFLAANSTFHTVSEFPRALHRSLGLYFEFWGWDFLRALGPRLRQITNGYHAGVTRVVTPGPVAPKYREIAEEMTHAAE